MGYDHLCYLVHQAPCRLDLAIDIRQRDPPSVEFHLVPKRSWVKQRSRRARKHRASSGHCLLYKKATWSPPENNYIEPIIVELILEPGVCSILVIELFRT